MADKIQRHFDYGFTMIDNRIFESSDFDKLIDKFLFMTLLKFSYGKSSSFPSIPTLARHCLSVKNTLKKSLERLENRGYIHKEQRIDDKGNHLSNIYHLYEIPRSKNDLGVGQKMTEGRSNIAPGVGQKMTPKNISFEEDELKNIVEIVNYLNNKAGTKYRLKSKKTQSYIQQRLAEGFSVDDFKTVIDKKCKQWLNDPTMVQYLRPSTLFSSKHFEEYLNEIQKQQQNSNTSTGTGSSFDKYK